METDPDFLNPRMRTIFSLVWQPRWPVVVSKMKVCGPKKFVMHTKFISGDVHLYSLWNPPSDHAPGFILRVVFEVVGPKVFFLGIPGHTGHKKKNTKMTFFV